MAWIRLGRWSLLMLIAFGTMVQQQASAQIPIGTTRTGTFIWDGERWIPAEEAPPAAPAVDVVITASTAPPPLPVYVQPPCPEPNLIWAPGYWRFGAMGFFWVPGAWVPAPYVGALWTPGYWGWSAGQFLFHSGYWGPHIGFYGGVNYGGGYMGIGFAGGSWNGGAFAYNTAVVNVNRTSVTNVYVNKTIVEQTTIINTTNVSYNGGPMGIQHQPAPEEMVAAHEQHIPPTTFQKQHVSEAAAEPSNLAKNNGGHPTTLAQAKPLAAEVHPPPSGFRPLPARPTTELATAQAPPETVAAAHTATAKTATVAKTQAPAADRPATASPARPEPVSEPRPATTSPAKPKPEAETKPAATSSAKPKPEAEPKPKPESETKPKPESETKPKPESETKPKPESKPKPKPKPESETKPE
jgi:WXXGXW repeat (2 copies)